MMTETEIRAELMDRLRKTLASEDLQATASRLSIERLRKLVEGGEAQGARYAAMGFTDAATECL